MRDTQTHVWAWHTDIRSELHLSNVALRRYARSQDLVVVDCKLSWEKGLKPRDQAEETI